MDEHKPSTSFTPRAYFISPITTHQRAEATQHVITADLNTLGPQTPFSTDDIFTFLQVTPADWRLSIYHPSALMMMGILLLSGLRRDCQRMTRCGHPSSDALGRSGGD
ncbi:hypothetical protein CEXT_476611 [Caerostris extrusa]|uniref:Uncharacterized protein n=1 Tax=Caerostris extrusa TaxID=172846 RepID=A0AAV4P2Z3_CAEEX|nr:hypothetical protein CEXT_476611 [Caerostris extrusa]